MTGLLLAGGLGALLVVLGLLCDRRPVVDPLDRDGYFDRWQALHGDYDPRARSRGLRGWLTVVHALARPLTRLGVHPDVVTVLSAWLAGLVVVLADLGGHWWIAAGLLIVLSGLVDNLDGAVAVLSDRTSRWGYVLDSVVDRVCDALFLLAVVLAGCPGWLAVTCGFVVFLLEYLRARAGNAGGGEVALVTVAERPTRVIVLAPTLVVCGAVVGSADVVATVGAAVLLALTVVGLGQLTVAVRRQLG
jgi:CDP-diacylglycerol--glycerol-3-phosphate 3-phosphatidyltransferase